MREALSIAVRGVVQGVGFRPFVYNAAARHNIAGWVLNGTEGVFIHAEGESNDIDALVLEIHQNPPAAARVREIEMHEAELEGFTGFEIRYSQDCDATETTLVSPDLACCAQCEHELFDPANRRYHYPFINCTNCGPRFTIIDALPYDRPNTAMAEFAMCENCAAEYANAADRRFHAQPDACFDCGPHISWWESDACAGVGDVPDALAAAERDAEGLAWGTTFETSDAIFQRAASLLREGRIVAVKGLGGFHLVCDAENPKAIAELRKRKHRPGKALAVMMRNVEAVRERCQVNDAEARLLEGTARPIVLLRKRPDAAFAAGLADHLPELGVMLPYTPVQHLLLDAFGGMLVMTSGNLHDEPICIDDAQARTKLAGIADAFLGNNRAIRCRFDDSVIRVISAGSAGDAVQTVRRARSFAPLPVTSPVAAGETLLACGPEQKNTFCLLRGSQAFVSQHIGDMESAETFDAWLESKAHFEKLFRTRPAQLACDMHPEYLSSKWAVEAQRKAEAEGRNLPVQKVQHHHAHIVGAMAECGVSEATIGVAFDGTGYGVDGAIWGGEVMLCNLRDFERFANFAYVPMPGGAAAVKNPLRMAYGVLYEFDLLEHAAAAPAIEALGDGAALCGQMIERGINCPVTSSAGRLFDAASALLGVCETPLYEGEAAILLEAAMHDESLGRPRAINAEADAAAQAPEAAYHVAITKNAATETSTAHDTSVVLLDAAPVFESLLNDMAAGVRTSTIARKFHDAMVEAVLQSCMLANAAYGITTVALAGGVFMNRYLVEHALAALEAAGFTVAVNKELPPNDGGVSYGQAVIAAAKQTANNVAG